ncbi:MAG: hypothetical protein A2234_05635 [Elusimicrobia bacterium RIFOXYA2_FULL_58_8]|nr:MAG: hypothetical protein A2285_02970 [Elusimicrobia bacterium RIFOXYA12_FULL_57_11]OGS13789.1 MAG: hypothetical protein A2234_05635 [Elusimicrobia bacterium RIFOXYA2_FULL_58_8]
MYRILSVEDDQMMQSLLRHTLEAYGYEVLFSSCGGQAIPMAISEKPDLILLDVNLPDTNGIDVCRALKADPKTRHIPVVMLTGGAMEVMTRVAGLDSGAEDYLLKPVSPRVLVARIGAILKQVSRLS